MLFFTDNIHSASFLGLRCSVHTKKVEKRSRFLWVYCQKSENVYRFSEDFLFTSGIFPKNLKTFSLFHIFPEKVSQRVYCQNFEERSGFAELFQKNFLTTGILPKNPKVFSLFPNFFQKSAQRVYFLNF